MQVGFPSFAQTEEAPPVVDSVTVDPGQGDRDDEAGALSAAEELALEAEEAARQENVEIGATPRPAAPQTRFILRKISLPRSNYLEPEAVDAVVSQLIGRRVDLRDLEILTAPLNALYRDRGINLANVVIREIDLKSGTVEMAFYEPRIGRVRADDGALARGAVYARRLALETGDLADTRRIEARQTRLELLTGVTTEITVQQGEAAEELDLVITPNESGQNRSPFRPAMLRFSGSSIRFPPR